MALVTISPAAQQRLAVFVPIIALGVSLFIVYPAWGRYSDLSQQIQKNRDELQTLRSVPPPPPIVAGKPTADDVVSEPTEFLALVRRTVAGAGCKLVSVSLTPSASKDKSGPIRPVEAKIDVVGEYHQIRSLLWQIDHSGRLLAITEFSLGTDVGSAKPVNGGGGSRSSDVQANISIERYVAPKTKAPDKTS